MSIEKEVSLVVDEQLMPDLSDYPKKVIEQHYLTPRTHDLNYPETENVEWRIRKSLSDKGVKWTTAIKIGQKSTGSRIELGTEVSEGAFGTSKEDISGYGFGGLIKRRYDLGDDMVVDEFIRASDGPHYQGEKEFDPNSDDDPLTWPSYPNWLTPALDLPTNRDRVVDTKPALGRGQYPLEQTVTRHQLLDSLSDDVADSGPTIITVSGVSGSGKSTIAELLARRFNGAYLEADHTHIGLAKLLELHGAENHDLIETYDYELVAKLAAELATGNSVQIPQYDFATAERTPTLREIKPRESGVVVVDGLYASELERVIGDKQRAEKKLKLKHVFVDTPLYVSVIRRILRDCSLDRDSQTHREVTFSDEGSLAYMVNTAIPTYLNSDYSRKFDYIAR